MCGNQATLGSWSLSACPALKDDGVPPDEAAGDGIYTVAVQLSPTALLEYKILPTGTWDGAQELKQVGSCSADGKADGNLPQNSQVQNPDTSRPTLFFFDGRTTLDQSFAPAPGNRSGSDSAMLEAPAGSCPTWVAVGDFQNLMGPNGSAAKLEFRGRGLLMGHITAAKPLAAGWRWKVVSQSASTVREYGPSGWAYAPCEAAFATVSSPVSPGDSVYFLFHTEGGRLQTLVSSSPLDGFMTDGATCQPPSDLAQDANAPGPDLGTAPSASEDLASPDPSDAATPRRRPGIHCDCQLGRHDRSETGSPRALIFMATVSAFFYWRRRYLGHYRFMDDKAQRQG